MTIYIYIQWVPLNRILLKGIFWIKGYHFKIPIPLYVYVGILICLLNGIALKGIFWIIAYNSTLNLVQITIKE